jgi:SlyX protein
MNTNIELTTRIEELEMKLMFQDELIEKLSQSLIRQQDDMRKLTRIVDKMNTAMQDMQTANVVDASMETPPPHY